MAFPSVIVECAFNSILSQESSAQTGFTDITKYVESISGTLRGRSYELDSVETGSITVGLDNSDGRFTPGSPLSPYHPYVKANRRFRIRGRNLQRINIARGGGQEQSADGFFRDANYVTDATDGVTFVVTEPYIKPHNPVSAGFTGDLLEEETHVEAILAAGATAGTYRVLSWWGPVELGVRLAHSVYVWRGSGTEPAGTTVRFENAYYDADGNQIDTDNGVEWSAATPAAPTRRVFADLPPGTAAYMIQSIVVVTTLTTTTPITYNVTGVQSEIPTGNLVPSISGYPEVSAWELPEESGTVELAGTDETDAYVEVTWGADDTELSITVPHLVPGDEYTFVVEARKSGGPDVLLTGDDGLTGDTLSADDAWTTLRTTFFTPRAEQPIKLIPQGTVVAGETLWVRLARLAEADPALPLATTAIDTDETEWARPIPIFDGWVERWPVKTTASASTISITVNDRMKKLGEILMESTLKQTIITDSPALLIPFTDDPTDSGGIVSILGDWSDESETSQVEPSQTKYGAGAATFVQGGLIGPTEEDAAEFNQAASNQGYVLEIPFSLDYVVAPPPVVVPKPVPKPPVVTTYKKTYYATWSRSYNGSNNTRYNDPATLYQGASGEAGDTNGNQRSLIGFNWNAINADLRGASVLGATVSLFAIHWWYYAGGTGYLGTHTKTSKPGSYDNSGVERRWKQTKWPRNAWRTINIGASGGVLFQKGTAKGIVVGWGDNNRETYGYLAGATMSKRPYLTITYKK